MRDSEAVAVMRRELGRQLAERRRAAGYVQRELGRRVGYSRTAIANAETGNARVGRQLWQRVDVVLGTGELFARGYDRIQAQAAAEARAAARHDAFAAQPLQASPDAGWGSPPVGQARQTYREWGWPMAEDAGGRLWLVTGTVIDALEVPRQAGLVAMGWWLYTRGVADEIRGLPALPDPAAALAVVAAGDVCYFLVRSGACPWTRHDTAAAGPAGPGTLRWHAEGGRVPAPPSLLADGAHAQWAHAPTVAGHLVSPMALLHVLAHAAAATQAGTGLLLPGDIRAVPAPPAIGQP